MKQILILIISLTTLTAIGQRKDAEDALQGKISPGIHKREIKPDSVPMVEYITLDKAANDVAYFINGDFFGAFILKTIDPKSIDKIEVVKQEIEVNGATYTGQIHIKLKKEYKPEYISLNDLKAKYTTLPDFPVLFMIDDEIINADYDKFLVDEKFILKIIADRIDNAEENLNVNFIRLITKTDENIKKANEIRIRGTEELKQ